ncbi:hypothetical protein BO83DRAFT_438207 [Aspergillus eucalypticola CBS 122712]|uniref:GPI anchored protein n=1 Tax=Aspergillus eucalypticola (strain CBS 122712 / IBT 29274) TaxID=1448314 RepID=A0A317VB20_ASPEC|nr:uncharacterized protein BO83DRAFT_438207 [Aspergillus eucalypticola CBS 122712]PWY71416.1 hypothetical protein BO83DRAFT_438207 [Aspergillus eucalypticola CBS 122712]
MFFKILALFAVTVLATLNDVTNQGTPAVKTVTTLETVTGSPVTTGVTKTVTPDTSGNATSPFWSYLTSTPLSFSISSSSSSTRTSTSESSAASTASESSSVSTGGAPDITGGLAMRLAGAAGALGFALAL